MSHRQGNSYFAKGSRGHSVVIGIGCRLALLVLEIEGADLGEDPDRPAARMCPFGSFWAARNIRLSCHSFRNNAVRLQLHALAYNLGNFLRTLALPETVEHWSLTTLREKLIKIGAKIVRHGRYVTFQLAEVAIPRTLFADILRRIDRLRPKPLPT